MTREPIPAWLVAVLAVAAALALAAFSPWIVLAIWLGLYARRIERPLRRWLGGRLHLSSAFTVAILFLLVTPIVAVLASLVVDAVALIQQLMESDRAHAVFERLVQGSGGAGGGSAAAGSAAVAGSATAGSAAAGSAAAGSAAAGSAAGPGASGGGSSGIVDLLMSQGNRAWQLVQQLAGVAARAAIGGLILVGGIYGVLVEGPAWYAWIERHAPMQPTSLRRMAAAFVETGRGLLFGIVGAGLIQSVVATIAYLVLGVPQALALGLLTLVFSVIPAIGTAIVWVPVVAGLALTDRTGAAIALTIVGVALISTADNLVRPWLARRGKLELPTYVVLIAMFGGIELIGGWGLLLGPLVVRLAKEAVVIRSETRSTPPPAS